MAEKKSWSGGAIFLLILFIVLIFFLIGWLYYHYYLRPVQIGNIIIPVTPKSGSNYVIVHKTTGRNLNVDIDDDIIVTTALSYTTWLYTESGEISTFNPSGIFDKFIIRDANDVDYGEASSGNNQWTISGSANSGYTISPETNSNLCIEPNSSYDCKLVTKDNSDNQKFFFVFVA